MVKSIVSKFIKVSYHLGRNNSQWRIRSLANGKFGFGLLLINTGYNMQIYFWWRTKKYIYIWIYICRIELEGGEVIPCPNTFRFLVFPSFRFLQILNQYFLLIQNLFANLIPFLANQIFSRDGKYSLSQNSLDTCLGTGVKFEVKGSKKTSIFLPKTDWPGMGSI